MTRLLIYGTFSILAGLLLIDTNIGSPVPAQHCRAIHNSISYIEAHGCPTEAHLASRIARSEYFRTSLFYARLAEISQAKGVDFGFYAYTPMLSRSRVFLSEEFWGAGAVGRSSLLVHEMSHVMWHRKRFMRGFPRRVDEAQAYRRQYLTYRRLRLSPNTDGMVYWNMMMGIQDYLIPLCPEYARRPDVRSALRELRGEG